MAEEMMQDDIGEEEVEQDQYLIFAVKSQEFGIQAMRVQEITTMLETTQVPNAPTYIEGIVNLQGRLASVINFRKKLGFEAKEHDEDTRIIVAEHSGFPIGIVVDSVEEVVKLPREAVQNLPDSISSSASQEYIAGVAMLDRRLIVLLDVDQVLTKSELIEVGAVTQAIDAVHTRETPENAESNTGDAAQLTMTGIREGQKEE